MTNETELEKIQEGANTNKILITSVNNGYLIDYDPVEKYIYFAECAVPTRHIIMSCSKTRGIYRISTNQSNAQKEVGY